MNPQDLHLLNAASQWLIMGLARNAVYGTILCILVWSLFKLVQHPAHIWPLGLWALVLLRFLLPPDLATPFSIGALGNKLVHWSQPD